MKLLFKQRLFSWLDSYDIFDESGETVFTVQGEPAWGHNLRILDAEGKSIGQLKEVLLSWLPRFEMYVDDVLIGTLRKEATFFRPKFTLDMNGWTVQGNLLEWEYSILHDNGAVVATISKHLNHWTDTYAIDIPDPADVIPALMVVLAIDAEKCSRN